MADKTQKYDDNAPGAFYVDEECIACDACMQSAPKHFKMTEDNDHAFVTIQPQNDEEQEECMEALQGCPVDAIGQDGN